MYIADIIEPKYNFEHNVQHAFIHQFFESYRIWFINNCHATTNENRLIALKIVETNIKQLEESLFTRKPWKSENTEERATVSRKQQSHA